MKIFIIDAFTDKSFEGNPAGVCIADKAMSPELMQSVASELNLSETAFLTQSEAEDDKYHIRYFTPAVEIDFCGHATLGAAKLMLHQSGKPAVHFLTHKNLALSCYNSEGGNIKMIFPLYDAEDFNPGQLVYEAFGIKNPAHTKFAKELDMLIIEVESKEVLLSLKPDFAKAMEATDKIKEVVVTAKSNDSDYDFYSRCFCPWIGINEDPVTGASHAVLAKYWGKVLNKKIMNAYQLSQRGGFMQLRIISETELEVISNAVIVFEGHLNL